MISGNPSHGILVKKRGKPNTEIKHSGSEFNEFEPRLKSAKTGFN